YIHDIRNRQTMVTEQQLLACCVCHKVRLAARAVTRAYDEVLRPSGLRASQLSVLAALAVEGAISITALAKSFGMDRSTLTRNLGPLEKDGLVALGSEGWRRSRTLTITNKGRDSLRDALPLWEKAQQMLQEKLGNSSWSAVHTGLDHLTWID